MDFNKNYYDILSVKPDSDEKTIKKAYYKLSFKYHPDQNKDVDPLLFNSITEAYNILCSNDRDEYDMKSKFGNNYNEYFEFFKIDIDFNYEKEKNNLDNFKKYEIDDIYISVDETFDGNLEYERCIKCKTCDGTGKDLSSKIVIKDNSGKVIRIFDADDGCDFCFEGNNYVITDNGYEKIKDIKIGNIVLSSDGYQKVTHLLERCYTGNVLDINVSGLMVTGVTPNHKFNIVRFNRNSYGRVDINNYKLLEIKAEDLTIDDFIIYKPQNYIKKDKIFLEKTHTRCQKEIIIDSDFVKFVACYIAEGNTRGDRVVVFTFDKEKDKLLVDFIDSYISKIGDKIKILEYRKEWGERVCKIEIYNSQLAKFIKLFCGHLAENKFINIDIIGSYDDILLETLLLCDGYEKKNTKTYTTISKRLAYQVFHISQKLGYNSYISNYIGYIDKKGVNHKTCYRVYITKSKKMGAYRKVIKEGICLKIRDIKKRNVISSNVYNITVENTHKYTIDGLLVNNCEGSGKNYMGDNCTFCSGVGKIGMTNCKTCNGEKRILGKQKISNIKLTGDITKLELMGNCSKNSPGKVGNLFIKTS